MTSLRWAEYGLDEEDTFGPDELGTDLTSAYETQVDSSGFKKITSYKKNNKGEDVKVIRKIKVIKKEFRINKAIQERMNLPIYGTDESEMYGNNDEVYMDFPKRLNRFLQGDEEDLEYLQDPLYIRENKEIKGKLKKFKDELEYTENSMKDSDRRLIKHSERTDKTPSNLRQEDCTVRVSNLSEYASVEDITELFSKIGRVQRVYLAKDRENKYSKGFAFVMYFNHEDAAKAITQLNRHGYDNLLMTVEWAKPTTREK